MHFDKIRQTEPCVDGEVRLTDALTKKQSVKFTARFFMPINHAGALIIIWIFNTTYHTWKFRWSAKWSSIELSFKYYSRVICVFRSINMPFFTSGRFPFQNSSSAQICRCFQSILVGNISLQELILCPNRKSSRMLLRYVYFPLRHRLPRKDSAMLLISFKWEQLFLTMNWRVPPQSYLFSFHWLCWFPHSCLSWYILSQSSNIYHQYLSTYISNHCLC